MAIDDMVGTDVATPEAASDTAVTAASIAARVAGGCPVMHEDFSPRRAAGTHWERADELREGSPVYFNTFAQGYWIFTRHDAVRDIYKTPEIFSSESFTPWEPEPIYRFVPTQIDPPDHIKYRRILNPWFSPRAIDAAEPMMRELCRRLVETTAPGGSLRLRQRVRAALSDGGLPGGDRRRSCERRSVRALGRGLLRRLRRRRRRSSEPMTEALEDIREYWVQALAERRGEAEPREGDLASYLLHATFDDRPLSDTEMLDMLHGPRARRPRHDAGRARLHVPPPRHPPRAPAAR